MTKKQKDAAFIAKLKTIGISTGNHHMEQVTLECPDCHDPIHMEVPVPHGAKLVAIGMAQRVRRPRPEPQKEESFAA